MAGITINLLAEERYETLESPVFGGDSDPEAFVSAYQAWAIDQAGVGAWSDLEFVKDLEKLLRIPTGDSVRVYPPRFDMYGWSPNWNDAVGDPQPGKRPDAMLRSRDVDV
jgi:hypothetical protein